MQKSGFSKFELVTVQKFACGFIIVIGALCQLGKPVNTIEIEKMPYFALFKFWVFQESTLFSDGLKGFFATDTN